MENASKALIISAEILIGVLLLTLMVFLFHAMGTFSGAVDKNIETKNVNEFNVKFEYFKSREDITAQDIVTMGNLAREYNEQMGSIQIQVVVKGVKANYQNAHTLNNKAYEFIQEYSNYTQTGNIIYFRCTQMSYDGQTGKINKIQLEKIE